MIDIIHILFLFFNKTICYANKQQTSPVRNTLFENSTLSSSLPLRLRFKDMINQFWIIHFTVPDVSTPSK